METQVQVTVADMMRAREARAAVQHAWLTHHLGAVVVCLCMNVAGPVKTNGAIRRAFFWGLEAVRAVLAPYEVLEQACIDEGTGPEAAFCVYADALTLKRRLCMLEDGEALGRLLDIDVIAPNGEKVSRTALDLPARRCLLCSEAAPICARSRAHRVSALFQRAMALIDAHFEADFVRRTAQQAQRALLFEVAVSPKPGLVDRENCGAHTDMDVFTFIDSACALRPYFETCVRTGLAWRGGDAAGCFEALRVQGLLAEADMREATAGVNTHKGAIFSLGIVCAALGMGFDGEHSDAQASLLRAGEMTGACIEREFSRIRSGEGHSFGEQIYRLYGVGGVRAEAAAGFPSVREAGLPRLHAALAAGLHINDAGLCVLTALMARTQDTNAVRRGGQAGAQALRERACALDARMQQALLAGTAAQEVDAWRTELRAWDAALCAAHISPGGCADMLALTLLIDFMEA